MYSHQIRAVIQMEFLSRDGVRLELDGKGWRILNPRQLGEKQLAQARALMERAEACLPPQEPDAEPPTLAELGDHAAKQLDLRINHRRFRHGK